MASVLCNFTNQRHVVLLYRYFARALTNRMAFVRMIYRCRAGPPFRKCPVKRCTRQCVPLQAMDQLAQGRCLCHPKRINGLPTASPISRMAQSEALLWGNRWPKRPLLCGPCRMQTAPRLPHAARQVPRLSRLLLHHVLMQLPRHRRCCPIALFDVMARNVRPAMLGYRWHHAEA